MGGVGDQIFLGWSKGGPFFSVFQAGGGQNYWRIKEGGPHFFLKICCTLHCLCQDQNCLTYANGGGDQVKLATGHHKQMPPSR